MGSMQVFLLVAVAGAAAGSPGDLAKAYDLGAYPEARCLDGSAGRYYLRPGQQVTASPRRERVKDLTFVGGRSSGKIYIHQQGGGFCTSLEDCAARAKTALGSTSATVPDAWGPTANLTAMQPAFSRNATQNPLLAAFTQAHLRRCFLDPLFAKVVLCHEAGEETCPTGT